VLEEELDTLKAERSKGAGSPAFVVGCEKEKSKSNVVGVGVGFGVDDGGITIGVIGLMGVSGEGAGLGATAGEGALEERGLKSKSSKSFAGAGLVFVTTAEAGALPPREFIGVMVGITDCCG